MYCDPEEVLHHLNRMGYENVTEKQLKEFIRDLKKLIKYDQRKNIKHREHKYERHRDESNAPSHSSDSELLLPQLAEIKTENTSCSYQNSSGEETYTSCDTSTSRSDIDDIIDHRKYKDSLYPRSSKKDADVKKSGTTESGKGRKSFIRSWRLNQPSNNLKNDPVSRYQWYQDQWNKQKIPGEEDHKNLRWMVRERMLGDLPHPRPSSETSGRISRNARK